MDGKKATPVWIAEIEENSADRVAGFPQRIEKKCSRSRDRSRPWSEVKVSQW